MDPQQQRQLTELIAEQDLCTIAHHHDFAWERQRFATHRADDYLAAAFPPPMDGERALLSARAWIRVATSAAVGRRGEAR